LTLPRIKEIIFSPSLPLSLFHQLQFKEHKRRFCISYGGEKSLKVEKVSTAPTKPARLWKFAALAGNGKVICFCKSLLLPYNLFQILGGYHEDWRHFFCERNGKKSHQP
jgi:hypothetical protein